MSDLFDLSGRIALVTGANTGLGQAIAVALARAGADIVAVGRTRPDETASQVRAAGRKLHAIDCDLAAKPDTRAIVKEARTHWKPEFDGEELSIAYKDHLYDDRGLPK